MVPALPYRQGQAGRDGMSINVDTIPGEFKKEKRWIVWKPERLPGSDKPTKQPFQPRDITRHAANNNPVHWESFEFCMRLLELHRELGGIGYVLQPPYCALDYDHVFNDGKWDDQVVADIERLGTYSEISQSGEGIHIIGIGTPPGKIAGVCHVMDSGFLYLTGNLFPGAPGELNDITDTLKALHEESDLSNEPEEQELPIHKKDKYTASIEDDWGLDLAYIGMPDNPRQVAPGVWRGGHPEHGSTTGNNYLVDLNKGLWHCWRDPGHDTGGGALEMFAIKEQIIRCQDSGPGWFSALGKVKQRELFRRLEDAGYKNRNEKKVPVKKETLPKVAKPKTNLRQDDIGNAERFVLRNNLNVRHCHKFGKWFIWDGTRWHLDETGRIMGLAKETARDIIQEAYLITNDEKKRNALLKHAIASQNKGRIDAMLSLARNEVAITPPELDTNRSILNFPNGTLDLKTYEFRDPKREDYCTKITGTNYDKHAECPVWLKFLKEIMDEKQDLIDFIQRAFGYSLTGHVGERVILLCYGTGANGKSTLLNTFRKVLGDYAQSANSDTLCFSHQIRVRNDIASLRGARYVSMLEIGKERRLDEANLKALTGNDPITARFLHQEHFTYLPEFKIWLAFNHKPVVTDSTQSIWDRIKMIPFIVTIPPENRDPKLQDQLDQELPGIMNWAIEGLKKYDEMGLAEPDIVKVATKEYQTEQDTFGPFLDECCIVKPDTVISFKEIYKAYQDWCVKNKEIAISKKAFTNELHERGYASYRTTAAKGFRGIGLREEGQNTLPTKT